MSEYVLFWGIICLYLWLWINAVLFIVVLPWMDKLLDEIKHMNYNKAITKEDK